ncbi:MAG TPA: sugar transferase [Vicinamibacterales bacterium]|nr:sugar transferase [Vicinamibacterales bacterium]
MATSGFAARARAPLFFRSALTLLRDEATGFERSVPARFQASAHAPRLPVLSQEVFRGALRRERKRADRFEEAFRLLAVSLDAEPARPRRSRVEMAIAAIQAVTRETDIIGWLEADRVLGVIVPAAVGREAMVGDLFSRVRRELAARLDAQTLATISIQVRTESGSDAARVPTAADANGEIRPAAEKVRATLSDAAKRALDIAGSGVLLLLTAPVFAVVATLVKLTSPGPVLFRQERVGWTGQPFTMLKFRTMHVGADSSIHQQYVAQFITKNEAAGTGEAAFKIVNDPRVTAVGRVLRKTSLDELPQFWNVLRGEMSLVGPRPPLRYEVDRYRRWHHLRVLEAKPGITGLWQVVGRSRTNFDDMVRLDVRYARARTLWTDIKILLATPRAVISGRGAC